ncbi:MAG: hypothetical protein M3380_00590, partial [Chloroflexota bacterium]|nr:hypothetical protein [Chloroflexota bacterium]
PVRDIPVFRTELVIQVKARLRSAGPADGAGIDHVNIRITRISDDPSKPDEAVHERPEQDPGYCAFGGGEPDCTVWVFAEHGNTWPDGKPIANGRHRVNIQIHPRDESRGVANWDFEFEIRLP